MKKYFILLFFYINLIFTSSSQNHYSIIETSSGRVLGENRGYYYSFESIPYAEPPIGKLRFEPPKPLIPNLEIINGTQPPPSCMQWMQSPPNSYLEGEEDCLYLNVYTPSISKKYKNFPIFVYIHGGGFMFGKGIDGGHHLILKNRLAVVIYLNYRLGPLGFMSTGNNVISGNMGLKDQQLALMWIKRNSRSFNGDPDNILITGFSAGGASVHLHSLSEKTYHLNLAYAAVANSGSSLCPWVIVKNPLERAQKLATLVGCSIGNNIILKDCLKKKAAADIVTNVKNFEQFLGNPFRSFGPVIEHKSVTNPFLTEHPIEIIKKGELPKIPILFGLTKDEGGFNAAALTIINKATGKEYLDEFLKRFDELAPIALFPQETLDENQKKNFTNYLKNHYNLRINDNSLKNYFKIQNIFTDTLFRKAVINTVKLHRDYSSNSVYMYIYDNPAPYGIGNVLSNRTDINFGTVHGDDVFLMFDYFKLRGNHKFRLDEEIISQKFLTMLKKFLFNGVFQFDNINVPKNVKNSNNTINILKITKHNAEIKKLN